MMKLSKLVFISESMRKINSRFVRIVGYKTGADKNGVPTAVAKTWTPIEYNVHRKVVRSNDQNRYVSSIKFLDKKLNVRVSCSCPDYLFRWEWANNQVGASDLIFGNGEPPDDTNPEHRPGMCKHLLALRKLIKEKHGV